VLPVQSIPRLDVPLGIRNQPERERSRGEVMKIVVIGGTGLIGTKVVEKLKQKGHEVVAAAPCHIAKVKPETTYDNFIRDFGERFVTGYRALSAVDLVMNTPFKE